MVEDYASVGTNFRGDPDLPLPAGAQLCDIGEKNAQDIEVFFHFMFYNFLWMITRLKIFMQNLEMLDMGDLPQLTDE